MIIKHKNPEYFWRKFTYLLDISFKLDPNSEEYSKVTKLGWKLLDLYIEALNKQYFKGYNK